MPAELASYCLVGLKAEAVRLEVDVARGMPHFSVIGMVSTSVKEAKERVRSAILHSGFRFPVNRKIVNLAPAEVSKRGTHFDLPMAIGILVADGQMPAVPKDMLLVGELGLEGGVRPVSGILPGLLFAQAQGFKEVVLPHANLTEAGLVEGLKLIPVKSLREVVSHFVERPIDAAVPSMHFKFEEYPWDFGDISGQNAAKRALLVAAAGGHHVLMCGPPGSGKSILARAFPSLLPPLNRKELLEVMEVYSVAGQQVQHGQLSRPFRTVHQSCSLYGLVGGGARLMPGEISLAHHGVLFLDELPEFPRSTVEALRGPLEERTVSLRRGGQASEYPCEFQLIAAMNPCPCGHYGDPLKTCRCTAAQVARYQSTLSGPLLDRLDIRLEVPRVSYDELQLQKAESSKNLRQRVVKARKVQEARGRLNQFMTPKDVKAERLAIEAEDVLKRATLRYGLSGRAVHKVIKVARTVADLEGSRRIQQNHLMEALQYRLAT